MRKTRFMTVLFLVLAASFFFVEEFRQGLSTSISVGFSPQDDQWVESVAHLPERTLERLASQAETDSDAETLAFVALYGSNAEEKTRLAERAVEFDNELTWIFAAVFAETAQRNLPPQWPQRLQDWDPTNSYPYLVEGQNIWESRGLWAYVTTRDEDLDALAGESDWRVAMGGAFTAERIDDYHARRFRLERSVLRRHGLDSPALIYALVAHYSPPPYPVLKQFANLLVHKLGSDAERARRDDDALSYYWTVYHMGERLHMQSRLEAGRIVGGSLLWISGERLMPLLRATGRRDEAMTLELAEAQFNQRQAVLRGEDPLSRTSNYYWHGLWVHLFSAMVLLCLAYTVVAVGYVNLKLWFRTDKKGWVYDFLTISENYAPILLLLSCLGLYVTFYPFAQNFDYYMTAGGEIHDFEVFFANVLPGARLVGDINLPLENPFFPYAYYAVALLALTFGTAFVWKRMKGGTPPRRRVSDASYSVDAGRSSR